MQTVIETKNVGRTVLEGGCVGVWMKLLWTNQRTNGYQLVRFAGAWPFSFFSSTCWNDHHPLVATTTTTSVAVERESIEWINDDSDGHIGRSSGLPPTQLDDIPNKLFGPSTTQRMIGGRTDGWTCERIYFWKSIIAKFASVNHRGNDGDEALEIMLTDESLKDLYVWFVQLREVLASFEALFHCKTSKPLDSSSICEFLHMYKTKARGVPSNFRFMINSGPAPESFKLKNNIYW